MSEHDHGPADGGAEAVRARTTAVPTVALTAVPTAGRRSGRRRCRRGRGRARRWGRRRRRRRCRWWRRRRCGRGGPTAARTVAPTAAPAAPVESAVPRVPRRRGPGAGPPGAARCIADPDEFAAGDWGRRPLLATASELPRSFGDLLGLAAVDELLSPPRAAHPVPAGGQGRHGASSRPGSPAAAGPAREVADQVADDRLVAAVRRRRARWCCRACTGPGRRWSSSAAGSPPSSDTRSRSTRT